MKIIQMFQNTMLIGKIPFKPKKGFVLPKHRFAGPFNSLHLQLDLKDNPLPGHVPYNAVEAISMTSDIEITIHWRINTNVIVKCWQN